MALTQLFAKCQADCWSNLLAHICLSLGKYLHSYGLEFMVIKVFIRQPREYGGDKKWGGVKCGNWWIGNWGRGLTPVVGRKIRRNWNIMIFNLSLCITVTTQQLNKSYMTNQVIFRHCGKYLLTMNTTRVGCYAVYLSYGCILVHNCAG